VEDKRGILRSQIAKIEKQMDKLMDLYTLDNIPIDTVDAKIQKLAEEQRSECYDSLEVLNVSHTPSRFSS
jgi:hypothetical protein